MDAQTTPDLTSYPGFAHACARPRTGSSCDRRLRDIHLGHPLGDALLVGQNSRSDSYRGVSYENENTPKLVVFYRLGETRKCLILAEKTIFETCICSSMLLSEALVTARTAGYSEMPPTQGYPNRVGSCAQASFRP